MKEFSGIDLDEYKANTFKVLTENSVLDSFAQPMPAILRVEYL